MRGGFVGVVGVVGGGGGGGGLGWYVWGSGGYCGLGCEDRVEWILLPWCEVFVFSVPFFPSRDEIKDPFELDAREPSFLHTTTATITMHLFLGVCTPAEASSRVVTKSTKSPMAEKSKMQRRLPAPKENSHRVGFSSQGVTTVDTEIRTGDVAGSVAEEESDGTHQVLRSTHLTLRDEAGPLLREDRVLVEDFLGAVRGRIISTKSWFELKEGKLTARSTCNRERCS
jgi:hypothetical protein